MRGLILVTLVLLSGCASLSRPGDLIELQRQASAAYAAGDYGRASQGYAELVKQSPKDADLRFRLGNSLAQQGEVEAAMGAYREALLRNPKHAKAWHNLIYLQLQGVGHSVAQMYLSIDRNDPQVAGVVGQAEAMLKLYDIPLQRQEP